MRMSIGVCAFLPLVLVANIAVGQTQALSTPSTKLPPAAQVLTEEQVDVNLAVGENVMVSAAGVRSYSLGNPELAEVNLTPDNKQFVIVGKAPGSTTLLLIESPTSQRMYALNVFKRPLSAVERELSALLEGTPGVRVRRIGARFFIEGGVSTEPELGRIQHIASLFPGQVDSLVVLGGAAADRKVNVRVDFYFLQITRARSRQLGVRYPTRLGGPGITQLDASFNLLDSAFSSATASVVNQPLPGLDIAAAQGWAKVLKHSTVLASNGTEAKFASGGEQNFVVTSGFAATLTPLTFGTEVVVLPRFDPKTRELEVKLDAHVAELTPPVAAGTDLPGRDVSDLETLVSLKLGQAIVLSGIRSSVERHSSQGLPWLSQIPVLGALFGSQGFSEDEVEGAVLIVPSVVESAPNSPRTILDTAVSRFSGFTGASGEFTPFQSAGEK